MEITLENRKKATTNFPRSVFKRNNIVEERRASGLGVKREKESTDSRAQKMMRGKVELFVVPIVVKSMPPMVHTIK